MSDASSPKQAVPLPWILLSGVLGIFAVGVPANIPGTSSGLVAEKKADKKEDGKAAQQVSEEDPLKPIFDFYVTQDRYLAPDEYFRDGSHGYHTEFLIATVPDPIDSPFGYAFDQVVDAVQRAVERKDGYILDRTWLPWELDRRPKAKDDKNSPSNFREKYPGIMLFRHGRDLDRNITTPGLFVVFLVGETPMGGIHKRAFTKALQMMQQAGHSVNEPVRVVGPYFSGSQTSLQFIVGDWWDYMPTWYTRNPNYKFKIITGNASAVRNNDFFKLDPKSGQFEAWDSSKLEFSSTIIPTKITLNAILRYLARRDSCSSTEPISATLTNRLPGKVALLTESNTGFGKQFARLGLQDQLLVLRFPLHISRVKSEYHQAFKRKDEQKGLNNHDLLVPSISEDQFTSEGIPSQGGSTTTATNGQVMSTILSTIAREQCRYVGVIASDTRDKLFLIRLIREYCPDVHVFVTEADLLLTHPDYRYHMRGVIVGSTYPLFPNNQRWVKAHSGERILFPSVGAQGYYNATLKQLGLGKRMLEYRPPAFTIHDDPDELATQRPPVWISVVAPNGHLVPLQLFTKYEDPSNYVAHNPITEEEESAAVGTPLEYPGAIFPFAACMTCLWGYLLFLAFRKRSSHLFWDSSCSVLVLPNLCYRNLILGSQLILLVPILTMVITHAHAREFRSVWVCSLVFLTVVLTLGFVLAMFIPFAWPRPRWSVIRDAFRRSGSTATDRWFWLTVNILLIGLIVGFTTLLAARFWYYGDYTRRSLFFVRGVDIGTGLSPLTPLLFLCMGLCAWGYFHLKRLHLLEKFQVPSPYPLPKADCPEETRLFRRVHSMDAHLHEEVEHSSFLAHHGKEMLAALIGLAGLGVAIWFQSLPTVEGWAWDLLFFAGFWVLFALCGATLVHLYFLWSNTKKLLDSIALIPMMRAFSKLPGKISETFGKYLFTQRPQISHLQMPTHQLRLLVESVKSDMSAPRELESLEATADRIDRTLKDHLAGVSTRPAAEVDEELRRKFSDVSRQCLRALMPRWKTQPVDDAFGGDFKTADANQVAQQEVQSEPAWIGLAESVVSTQVVIYLAQFFMQIRNLVWAVIISSSLLLLSATSYPFHPERLLLMCLLGLIGAGVASVLYVLIEINRDEVVSRISKTTPGKLFLDSGFLGSFFTYIVPTVGILAAQLSGSFRWLLEPILRVMK